MHLYFYWSIASKFDLDIFLKILNGLWLHPENGRRPFGLPLFLKSFKKNHFQNFELLSDIILPYDFSSG